MLSWRLQQFLRLGLDLQLATQAAGSEEVDVREFEELVRDGCPPELAMRILR